jgi:hypothetical protein
MRHTPRNFQLPVGARAAPSAGRFFHGRTRLQAAFVLAGASLLSRSSSESSFNVGCEGKQVVLIVVDQITLVMEEEHPFVAFSSPSTAPLPDSFTIPAEPSKADPKPPKSGSFASLAHLSTTPAEAPTRLASLIGCSIRVQPHPASCLIGAITFQQCSIRQFFDLRLDWPRWGTNPHWRSRTFPNSSAI